MTLDFRCTYLQLTENIGKVISEVAIYIRCSNDKQKKSIARVCGVDYIKYC